MTEHEYQKNKNERYNCADCSKQYTCADCLNPDSLACWSFEQANDKQKEMERTR